MPAKQKTDLGTKVQVQLKGREFKFHLVKQKTKKTYINKKTDLEVQKSRYS